MSVVYLRIARKYLCPLTDTKVEGWMENTNDRAGNPPEIATGNLVVLQGELQAINSYAPDGAAGWLIDIAETLFGRDAKGKLWKLRTEGSATEAWLDNDREFGSQPELWSPISRINLLQPGIYEFRPNAPNGVVLSRLYPLRQRVKCPKPQKMSRNFSGLVQKRDKKCVISGISRKSPVNEASHLTPRRLGHTPIDRIIRRTGATVNWTVENSAHENPQVGVLLFYPLDRLVDRFKAGFYTPDPKKPNDHVVHYFGGTDVNEISILGLYHSDLINPLANINNVGHLHQAECTIKARTGDTEITIPAPPLAIFEWHYLQCVLRKFGTRGDTGIEGVKNIFW